MKKVVLVLSLLLMAGIFYAEQMRTLTVFEMVDPVKDMGASIAKTSARMDMAMLISQRGMIYHIEKSKGGEYQHTRIYASQKDVNTSTKNKNMLLINQGTILKYQAEWPVTPWKKVPAFKYAEAKDLSFDIDVSTLKKPLWYEINNSMTESMNSYLNEVNSLKKGSDQDNFSGKVMVLDVPEVTLNKDILTYSFKVKAVID